MDDLEKFTNLLFGELKGYVYSPTKSDKWTEKFFHWPEEKEQLHDWIKSNSTDRDVYLSPVVYKQQKADKASVKGSQVVWVEFDGDEQIKFPENLAPTAIVQTSFSTHLHAYWNIDPIESVPVQEDLNRRVTYYLDADTSGWDATQLLRPPGTFNHKYSEKPPVVLAHLKESRYPLSLFDVAPKIELRQTEVKLDDLKDPAKLLLELPLPLAVRKLVKEATADEPKRSSFLSKVALELAEEGVKYEDIVSLLQYVDDRIGKYVGRSDRLVRLSSLADFAIHKIETEDSLTLYTLQDVLDHTEDLKWIIPGWLHENGFLIITSAPGVGKTQWCFQLGVTLVSSTNFLNRKVFYPNRPVLFLSLEMDVRQLKYILSLQKDQWPKDLDTSRLVIVDEEGTLLQYEDTIGELNPGVVFLDSLSELLEEGEDARATARATMRWIRKIRRRYNCAVVAVHHNRKASEGNKKPKRLSDLYGSMHFARVVETTLCLWEERDKLELSSIKTRFGKSEAFHIKRIEGTLWFERVEDNASGKQQPPGSNSSGGFSF